MAEKDDDVKKEPEVQETEAKPEKEETADEVAERVFAAADKALFAKFGGPRFATHVLAEYTKALALRGVAMRADLETLLAGLTVAYASHPDNRGKLDVKLIKLDVELIKLDGPPPAEGTLN